MVTKLSDLVTLALNSEWQPCSPAPVRDWTHQPTQKFLVSIDIPPHLDNLLLQLTDIVTLLFGHPLLHYSPNILRLGFIILNQKVKGGVLNGKKPGSSRPKKAKRTLSKKRVILITIFDSIGLINHEFLPNWQTVDSDFYIQVIRRFREKLRKKRPEMWKSGDWILQHDGASSLTSAQTRSYMENMEKYKFEILLYPAYSPELALCVFFFISNY